MRREKLLEVFDNLPTKRRQVLLGSLRGDSRAKIMVDVGISEDALTQHRRQLYKDFQIEIFQHDEDDLRSGERKLPQLIALFAKHMPELISPNTAIDSQPDSIFSPVFPTYQPQTWVGRETIMNNLLPKLQGQHRLVWITGISGIGKTTLGECLTSRAWERNPSFQWFRIEIEEGQSPDFGSVVADLWGRLGEVELDPQIRNNPEQVAKKLLQKLQAHPYWIQIDALERLLNPEKPTEFVDAYWAVFLRCCLTESNFRSRLVLTSQAFPTALMEFSDRYPNFWTQHQLQGLLEVDQQLEFFQRRGLSIAPANRAMLTQIARTYEGHPLVMKVIAEDIVNSFSKSVDRYWQSYRSEFEQVARELQGVRVEETEYNEALDRKVRERIKKSLEHLPAVALELLCRSSVFRRPVPKRFWLGMMGNCTPQEQKAAYRGLDDRALIEKEGTDIRQHNLLRSIAYDLLRETPSAWEAAERQAADLWLTAYKPAADVPNLEKVRGYLEAFEHYCEISDWETAKSMLMTELEPNRYKVHWQLGVWSYSREQIQFCQRILGKLDAKSDGIWLNTLGIAYRTLGNYKQAINFHQQGLVISREIGDRQGEGKALGNLGNAYYSLGRYEEAIDFHQQCLAIAREIGDRLCEGNALGNLGNSYYSLGRYEEAIDFYQQALVISCEIGDRNGEGRHLVNIGATQIKLKQYSESLTNNQAALEIFQEIGDRANEAEALKNLAELHQALGDLDLARQYCQQALALATELGLPLAAECEALQLKLDSTEEV